MSSRSLALRAPRGFAANPRFNRDAQAATAEAEDEAPDEPPEPDPLEQAFEQGLREGEARAQQAHGAELEALRAEYAGLAESVGLLARAEGERLREVLRETVIALCEASIAPLALDPPLLAKRIERAGAMLQRAQDERRVRLHPDDLEQVRLLVPAGLLLLPDPALERGALRVETGEGGIDDGPASWRQAIREALGEC